MKHNLFELDEDSIDVWYRNNRQPMHCRQKTLTGGDCDGHRTVSEWRNVCQNPPVIYFEEETCPLGRLPNTVDINNTRYALYMHDIWKWHTFHWIC